MKCRLIASLGFVTAVVLLGVSLTSGNGSASGAKATARESVHKFVVPQTSLPTMCPDELVEAAIAKRDWQVLHDEDMLGRRAVDRQGIRMLTSHDVYFPTAMGMQAMGKAGN